MGVLSWRLGMLSVRPGLHGSQPQDQEARNRLSVGNSVRIQELEGPAGTRFPSRTELAERIRRLGAPGIRSGDLEEQSA